MSALERLREFAVGEGGGQLGLSRADARELLRMLPDPKVLDFSVRRIWHGSISHRPSESAACVYCPGMPGDES